MVFNHQLLWICCNQETRTLFSTLVWTIHFKFYTIYTLFFKLISILRHRDIHYFEPNLRFSLFFLVMSTINKQNKVPQTLRPWTSTCLINTKRFVNIHEQNIFVVWKPWLEFHGCLASTAFLSRFCIELNICGSCQLGMWLITDLFGWCIEIK